MKERNLVICSTGEGRGGYNPGQKTRGLEGQITVDLSHMESEITEVIEWLSGGSGGRGQGAGDKRDDGSLALLTVGGGKWNILGDTDSPCQEERESVTVTLCPL